MTSFGMHQARGFLRESWGLCGQSQLNSYWRSWQQLDQLARLPRTGSHSACPFQKTNSTPHPADNSIKYWSPAMPGQCTRASRTRPSMHCIERNHPLWPVLTDVTMLLKPFSVRSHFQAPRDGTHYISISAKFFYSRWDAQVKVQM